MLYCILDQPEDVSRLADVIAAPDSVLVPISAIARCGVPDQWPPQRLLRLSELLQPSELAAEVARRRHALRELFDHLPACPYYKTHQIIDVFLEKQIIVERLALLPGEKCFVDQRGGWLAVDGDNDERLRIAALYMRGLEGFRAVAVERMSMGAARLRLLARHLRGALRALKEAGPGNARFATGQVGYGAAEQFASPGRASVNPSTLIAAAIRRGPAGWLDALRLMLHDQPLRLEARAAGLRTCPFIDLLNELQQRSERVVRLATKYLAPWRGLDFYFTVNYGPVLDGAVVRAMRAFGVPVVSMQHALMGHDCWTASQYLDTWLSDAKIVSSGEVARSMREFERPSACETLCVRLPMLRRKLRRVEWSGRRVLYVLTGFTRANTMYDNRRVNDALYFDLIDHKLGQLAKRFEVLVRSHPYDARQYRQSIAGRLAARHGATLCADPLDKVDAAILIDSPSTILADALFAGRPVFLINETATLQPAFRQLAAEHNVAFDSIETLIEYLGATPSQALRASQEAFAARFAELYFGDNAEGLITAVDRWRGSHRVGAPS